MFELTKINKKTILVNALTITHFSTKLYQYTMYPLGNSYTLKDA